MGGRRRILMAGFALLLIGLIWGLWLIYGSIAALGLPVPERPVQTFTGPLVLFAAGLLALIASRFKDRNT